MNGYLNRENGNGEINLSRRALPSQCAARYTASFFGPFRVALDDNQLIGELSRRNRAALLLKWFLLNPARRVSPENLCALFWLGRRKESAINNLHVNLNHLRRVLEPELPPGCPSTFIHRSQNNYYWFDPRDLWWADIDEVRTLFAVAEDADRRGETTRAIALYDRAVDYYRLTFLPEDIYEDAFASYRQEHDLAYAQCLNRLMQLRLRASHLTKALSCAMDMMCIDPYNRDAMKTIIKVHARQGNIVGAICQLDNFLRTLKHDMGIAPDSELLALRKSLILDCRVPRQGAT
jgi:DNA-binding SARP family transcriptional activator